MGKMFERRWKRRVGGWGYREGRLGRWSRRRIFEEDQRGRRGKGGRVKKDSQRFFYEEDSRESLPWEG
jgi:hypothetical protein